MLCSCSIHACLMCNPYALVMSKKWKVSSDKCPRCNEPTEYLIKVEDGIDYQEAERCQPCGWVFDFDTMELKG